MSFKKHYLLISFVFLNFLLIAPVSAAIFKCTNVNGETVYSSKKCTGIGQLFSLQKETISEQQYENKSSVDIYITSWCPYCKKAIAYLRSKNVDFNIYDIGEDATAKARKRKLAPGYTGIPLTVINGEVIKGFSPGRFDKALNL